MINFLKALAILSGVAKDNLKHKHYQHVVDLACKYKQLITGDAKELIEQFNLREDKQLFEQRLRLTTLITPCITNTLMNPARKVPGVRPVIREIKYKKESKENVAKIEALIENYYGVKDLDFYMRENEIPISFSDPNAFILTTFTDFDHRYEKPITFSTVISSEDAVMYEYINNVLQYLVIKKEIEYKLQQKDEKVAKGCYWIIHTDVCQVEFSQVDARIAKGKAPIMELFRIGEAADYIVVDTEDKMLPGKDFYFKTNKDTLFLVKFYNPKTKRIPIYRTGFIKDLETNNETCVNLFHPAVPLLMKTIKTISELDIASALHLFPKLFQYIQPCPGNPNLKLSCSGGYTPDGVKCGICDGKGYIKHDSGQDVITLPLPSNKDDMYDLSKMLYYAQLPIDIVEWLDKYIDKLKADCLVTMYNSDVMTKPTMENTLGQTLIRRENIYDTLTPLGDHYSLGWCTHVFATAEYNDLADGLIVRHAFGKNFHFEALDELFAQLKAAQDAGATQSIKQEINNNIANVVFRDKPDILQKLTVMEKFNPFAGKTDDEIATIIGLGKVVQRSIILWSNFKPIFDELEQDQAKVNSTDPVSFYELQSDKQLTLLNEKVYQFKKTIEDETPKALPLTNFLGDTPPAN